MTSNERKDAFRRVVQDVLRDAPGALSKADLMAAVRVRVPEMFDDSEACFPGCKAKHPRWRHDLDRAIYDLSHARPKKIHSPRRGVYTRP